MPTPPTTRRRWFQFSLRSLLVLVVLASLGMAFWSTYVRPYRLQHGAAEELAALGAGLEWEPTGPGWLPWLTGRQFPVEIVAVHLDGKRKVEDKDLACLADLRSLRRLHLGRTKIGDLTLRRISRLKHLQRLSLWKTSIGDEGLRGLGDLPALEKLDIHHTKVGDAGLAHLARAKSLRWIDVGYNKQITADGLKHLARVRTLRELNFFGVPITADMIASLRGSRIERLRVSQIPKAAFDDLVRLTNLRRLPGLEGTVSTPETLKKLVPLNRLESLWVSPRMLGPGGTVYLMPFEHLEELTLCGTGKTRPRITTEDITRLARLPKLRSLSLQGANVGDDALRPIRSFSGLRKLDLRNTRITDAALAYVGALTKLEELNLRGTGITDAGLAHLRNLTKLRRLTCSSERVTDAGVDHLFGMTRLERLDLCGTGLSGEKAGQFHAKIPGCYIEDNWCCGCMAIAPKR